MSQPPTVAILGAGDMGSAVARELTGRGIRVTTCLRGRSERSRQLAADAGMADCGDVDAMLADAGMLLSIIPPADAVDFARALCPHLARAPHNPLLVDCNAVAPATMAEIATLAAAHGVRVQDVGIIGAAPRPGRPAVRFYTSGPFAEEVARLAGERIAVKALGPDIGRASAIKMVYASMTKGTHALRAAAALAGELLGVGDEIRGEWQDSLPEAWQAMEARLPRLPSVAGRWTGEMREISRTYEALGLTPAFHEGAEWVYGLLAAAPESIAGGDAGRPVEDAVARFLAALEARGGAT